MYLLKHLFAIKSLQNLFPPSLRSSKPILPWYAVSPEGGMHPADAAATRRCPSDFQVASAHSFSGKERELPLETAGQLHALQCAAELTAALGSATGKIIPPELTLKHAYDVQRDEWRNWAATVPAKPTQKQW